MFDRLQNIKIEKAYKFSMVLIAFLVTLSFINLFFIVDKQKEYALLINKSGKQRMYSEQARSMLQLGMRAPGGAECGELAELLEIMQNDYVFLKKSLEYLKFNESNIYTAGYKNSVLKYLYEPAALAQCPADERVIAEILNHHSEIVQELNRAVEQLQAKSDQLNDLVIKQGIVLLFLILIVLGMMSALIFKPLLRRVEIKHQAIARLNSELEKKVHERTQRLEKMLDIVNQYVYSTYTDVHGVITYVTDAFCDLSGYSRDELLGKTHSIIKHPDTPDTDFSDFWRTILKGETYQGVIKNRHKNGEEYWLDSYIVPDKNEEGVIVGFQAFRQNITDKVRLKELNDELEKRVAERTKEIERIAVTDALTGLFNRHRFNQELEDAIALYKRYQTPIVLAIFDIDHFKKINDTYGHNSGDNVLVAFAELLKRHMRQTDKLARWGGEEFVILFINTELSGALLAAENLLDSVRHHWFEEVGHVTCSIGLAALMPVDTPETILQRADTSLYRAKERGRNRVCYQYIG